ncbi:MAG: mechanosensitive ion channel family protein [Endomicrobium sp.]|jgi:miniconductance mechanosensitive channel|nr:mechanosensitive ion channel family protein [Endomicrobium sp.]
MQYIVSLFEMFNFPQKYIALVSGGATIAVFFILLFLSWHLFNYISHRFLYSKYFHLKNKEWQEAVKETNFLADFGYLGAGFIAQAAVEFFFPPEYILINSIALKLITSYFQLCILIAANDVLTVVYKVNKSNPHMPIKGIIQFIRIFINFFGILIMFAYFIGKEPTYFISALGVIASVLMIIFKDTILGLTASWQLAMNEMLHIGDWIEVPKHNADGEVIDISLTTISVQNWDKTIITIPAYDLIANSFQNWRGMSEAGGRRIKRAVFIDMQSIKFADKILLARLSKIELIKDYIAKKEEELQTYNAAHDITSSIINGRALTNIGVFRAYCDAYIKSRPYISPNFTTMVRQLPITPQGLPLEIYCFTSTTEWTAYERYQSDIFDHILSVMKEFDLCVFQEPTGANFQSLIK